MGAPFLTANDVVIIATDRGGIASVNGYDPIKVVVEVTAIMSESCSLRGSNLSELKGMIARELNQQFENRAPQRVRLVCNNEALRGDCAGWSNEPTWRLALAFANHRGLASAKANFMAKLTELGIELTPNIVRNFAIKTTEQLAQSDFDDIIFDDVDWGELTKQWMDQAKFDAG
jgi:hypothetical protein